MSKYLCQTQEVYRCGSEAEAAKLIEDAKADARFTLLKSSTEYKTVKAKGEIVDEYWKTTLTKHFTDLKEPDCQTTIEYKVSLGAFPDPVRDEDEE